MRNALLTLLLFGLLAASANPAAFYGGLAAARLRGNAVGPTASVPTDGLSSWWAPSITQDYTDYHGTNNATQYGGVGIDSEGYVLDGIDDYLRAGNAVELSPGTNDFSICAWVHTSRTNFQGVAGMGFSGSGDRWIISTQTNTAYAVIQEGTGAREIRTSGLIPTNAWAHLCLSADRDGNVNIYVNGSNVHSSAIGIPATSMNFTVNRFWAMGMYRSDSGGTTVSPANFFQGKLDHIMFYRRALSAQDIADIISATQK